MAPCKFLDLEEETESTLGVGGQSSSLNKEYDCKNKHLDPNMIKIMMKEYETLRQESLNSIGHRNTILTFGLAAIGAIFAGSILAYSNRPDLPLPKLALMLSLTVVIPFICIFIVLMWLVSSQLSNVG